MSSRKPRTNAIIAVVKRSRGGNPPTAIMMDVPGFPKLSGEQLAQSVRDVFGQEAIDEIGIIVLAAMLAGDRKLPKMVHDAIMEADHIFRRARHPELLRQALRVLYEQHGAPLEKSLKKTVEERFYQGEPLDPTKWNRVRVQLGWLKSREAREKGPYIIREAKLLLKRLESAKSSTD